VKRTNQLDEVPFPELADFRGAVQTPTDHRSLYSHLDDAEYSAMIERQMQELRRQQDRRSEERRMRRRISPGRTPPWHVWPRSHYPNLTEQEYSELVERYRRHRDAV